MGRHALRIVYYDGCGTHAQVRAGGNIDQPTAHAALSMLEVDRHGFDEIDRKLLLTIIEKYQGGPVGVGDAAAALAEEADGGELRESMRVFDLDRIFEPHSARAGRDSASV